MCKVQGHYLGEAPAGVCTCRLAGLVVLCAPWLSGCSSALAGDLFSQPLAIVGDSESQKQMCVADLLASTMPDDMA